MNTMSYGTWLKTERALKRVSQSWVEREAGMGHSHYSKLENGKIPRPLKETRDRLHHLFGTSDDDLVDAGVLRKRTYRTADGSRQVTVYEYVNDDAPRTLCEEAPPYDMAASGPTRILTMVPRVKWTETRVQYIVEIMESMLTIDDATARASDDEAQPSPASSGARDTDEG